MWHKKDAALFEVHINKRKGNKAKVAKAQALVDKVATGGGVESRSSATSVTRRST